MSPRWSAKGGWFSDPDYDYETRCILGAAACGIGDVGLVLATIDKVTSLDAQAWFDAWVSTAADLEARADAAVAAGHLRTARSAYLAASEGAFVRVDPAAGPEPRRRAVLPRPTGRQLTHTQMLDWLADHLPARS